MSRMVGDLGRLAALDLEVPQDLLPRLGQRGERGDRDVAVEVLDELLDRREYVVEQPRLVGRRRLLGGAEAVAEAVADGDVEVGAEVVGRTAAGLQLGEHPRERLGDQLVGALLADEDPGQPSGGVDLAAVELTEGVAVSRAGALEQRDVRVVPGAGREISHRSASVESAGRHPMHPPMHVPLNERETATSCRQERFLEEFSKSRDVRVPVPSWRVNAVAVGAHRTRHEDGHDDDDDDDRAPAAASLVPSPWPPTGPDGRGVTLSADSIRTAGRRPADAERSAPCTPTSRPPPRRTPRARTTTGSWPACSPAPTGSHETDVHEWNRFLGLLERHRANPKAALNCGVLANLVGHRRVR